MSNNNLYDVFTEERELREENPNYKGIYKGSPFQIDDTDVFGEPEYIGTGEFVDEVDLDSVLHLKLIEVIEELGNKLTKGRLKNVETEKVRLSYYKLYLDSIKTYLDFKKNRVGSHKVNVDELEPILNKFNKK
ncbi:MAG: hypothetical protein MJ211_15325 [Bacteroidales bacterium]|nr:hypothetical protein [Bacteroidales bacterium]